jgi:hypothetical protein
VEATNKNQKMRCPSFFSLVLVLALCGCSTVKPAKHFGNVDLDSLKSAYIVWSPGIDRSIEHYAREGLEKHGVTVTTGPKQDKPASAAFWVECQPRWTWDLVMYLDALDIRFVENTSEQIIAIGSFKNSFFHSFPDPRKKTIEVIDSMYAHK